MAHRQPLADIQFIADFAAFCRTKGDEAYEGTDDGVCALAQFGHKRLNSSNTVKRGVPFAAYDAAVYGRPHCFSALADRLEALIADAPAVERAR